MPTGGKVSAQPPGGRTMPVRYLGEAGEPEIVPEQPRARTEGELVQDARGDRLCANCAAFHLQDRRRGVCRLRPPFAPVLISDWCLSFEAKAAEPEPVEAAPVKAKPTNGRRKRKATRKS